MALSQHEDPDFSRGYRAWMLFLLAVVNALNLADRQGMGVTAPAIKAELHLSDTQLGIVQGLGFAILYTMLGLPLARLAERRSRAKIIAGSIAVFGLFVGLCSQARGFAQFLMLRVGVGVGDAGFTTPVASLTGDHYPADRRTAATTLVWLGGPIGALIGSAVGGQVAEAYGWRTWFIGLAIPSLLVALLAFVTLREPPRGRYDRGDMTAPVPSIGQAMRFLLAKRSMRHVIYGCAIASMGMNGLGQFLVRFMVAHYGIGLAEAGQTLGLLAVVAMASGLAIGGFGVTALYHRDRRWAVWAPAIGLVLAAPLFVAAAFQPTLLRALPLLGLAHVCLFIYYTPTLALAQNMVGSNMRASASFAIAFVLGMIGIGIGPTLIGIMSDIFAHVAFAGGSFAAMCPGGAAPAGAPATLGAACADASQAGITWAVAAMSVGFVWAALHYLLAARDLRRDLDTHYQG